MDYWRVNYICSILYLLDESVTQKEKIKDLLKTKFKMHVPSSIFNKFTLKNSENVSINPYTLIIQI